MDLLLSIAGIGLSIAVFIQSSKYDIYTYDVLGGGLFPRIMAVIITLCSLALIVRYVLNRKNPKKDKGEEKKPKNAFLLVLAVLIYIMALETVGYVVMTVALVAFLLWIQKVRKPKTLILSTVVICGMLYVIFVLLLRVRMPTGILI
jgi:cell division protein FtsW (lipid II flippase)